LPEEIGCSASGACDSGINGLLQLQVNQQVYLIGGEVGSLLTQVEKMPQDGIPLKGFFRCLRERETFADVLGSKLGGGLEFPACPPKEASSEFPRHDKAEV